MDDHHICGGNDACVLIVNFIRFVIILSVCNAGYYGSGHSCSLCTANEIKSTPGDAVNCSTDPPCDGTTNVPNSNHTACGWFQMKLY